MRKEASRLRDFVEAGGLPENLVVCGTCQNALLAFETHFHFVFVFSGIINTSF